MNKIFKNIIFASLHLCIFASLVSCSDYLETESKSSLTTGNFYTTQANIDKALIGAYGCLKPLSTYIYEMSEYRSDNLFQITEAKIYDSSDCSQFNSSSLLSNSLVSGAWSNYYKLITACNVLIDHIDEASFTNADAKTQYLAEAHFLRGLAYFDMVRFFGRIPASTHELSTTEAFALGQSEPLDIYKNIIIPDLKYAAENLQATATDYLGATHTERVKKIAAQALLGKAYLQMAGFPLYQETKDLAKEQFALVLNSVGALNLNGTPNAYWAKDLKTWNSMWFSDNDNKFFLFEIQYACAKDQGNPITQLARTGNTSADAYCSANLTTGNHIYVDRDLQSEFFQINKVTGQTADGRDTTYTVVDTLDYRMENTINTSSSYDEETATMTGGVANTNNFMVKFFENKLKRKSFGYSDIDATIVDRTYWPQNFPLLRLEDIMLLYAEIVGPTDEGNHLLQLVHNRAANGKTSLMYTAKFTDNDAFQAAVIKERRHELLGEGQRWFDEVRHNTYVEDSKKPFISYRDNYDSYHSETYTTYANRVAKYVYLYPIPLSQIQVREGLYTQNEGY